MIRTITLLVSAFLLVPAVALAGGGLTPAELRWDLFVHAFNLIVLLAILRKFVWPTIRDFFATRSVEISRQLEEAAEARTSAQAEYDRINERLSGFDKELDTLLDNVRTESTRQHEAAVERANAAATAMVEAAQKTVKDELSQARNALRREAIDLAVELAAEKIRSDLSDAQQGVLVERVLTRVERASAPQEAQGE